MNRIDGLLGLLDTRAFPSLWYWIALAAVWTMATRGVLGVPGDVILRARLALRSAPDEAAADAVGSEALLLLDWLSLTLPRWRLSRGGGAVILAVATFILTSLALLGFVYGREMAQALTLLLLPLAVLIAARVGLARRLDRLLISARHGELGAAAAAAQAARALTRHRLATTGLSILAVAIAAAWGTLWNLQHPNGL